MSTIKRTWSIEEKISILKDIEKTGVVEECQKHGFYATTYYDWKKKYDENGAQGLVPRYGRKESGELKKVQKENERLKKLLAEKELELSIKSDLLKKKMAQWKSAKK